MSIEPWFNSLLFLQSLPMLADLCSLVATLTTSWSGFSSCWAPPARTCGRACRNSQSSNSSPSTTHPWPSHKSFQSCQTGAGTCYRSVKRQIKLVWSKNDPDPCSSTSGSLSVTLGTAPILTKFHTFLSGWKTESGYWSILCVKICKPFKHDVRKHSNTDPDPGFYLKICRQQFNSRISKDLLQDVLLLKQEGLFKTSWLAKK